jgi:hypothetical protein
VAANVRPVSRANVLDFGGESEVLPPNNLAALLADWLFRLRLHAEVRMAETIFLALANGANPY